MLHESLGLDAGGLDHRPPFLDLGPLQRAECLRGLLRGWENVLAELGEARPHSRLGQGRRDGGIELADDILGRAFRCPQGMPVIDDPMSMIRCTNKVFLMELLGQNQVATPPTVMLPENSDLHKVIDELGLPLVVKIPDGSFSRGIHKVSTMEEFKRITDELFEETDLLLAQKFLPTEFDWRVGVLSGEPLFVCQYRMARGHWQIVKHRPDGSSHEGGFRTFELDKAPRELIDIAVRAARPIGEGFYGVDIKETERGFIVMEVNDNPNLEHGIEDQVGKDEIWTRLLKWFIERFEQ